jgi:UDP-N-acetylglucosamine 2-epimerase (non-hydrolysing)
MTYRVLSVVGTRPNFVKVAPVVAELQRRSPAFESILVHTGQHYDAAMSDVFFDELGFAAPDHFLGAGSGTHAQQTARIIERLDPIIADTAPDMVLVAGDVNSTLASAVVAAQRRVPIGHIESGLRSFDRTMPEEVNRVLVDALADLLFTHSPEAADNLEREGRPADAVFPVGNTMIDTLERLRPHLDVGAVRRRLGLATDGGEIVVTLHRPALVDGPLLGDVVAQLARLAREQAVIFPCHPRTRARLESAGADLGVGDMRLVEPLGYLDFTSLVAGAGAVLTDSGGIQEESTVLGVPCLTLRDNTERPITVELGTNRLLGLRPERIAEVPALSAEIRSRPAVRPPGWDGHAAPRLVDVVERWLDNRA